MDSIGGYRLLRKIGEGPRAQVHLAVPDDLEGGDGVVIKQYRPEVDAASISTEIEALARGVGEHTVALLDVSSASGAPALVLARLTGGSLGRLLARRSSLSLGESVAVLGPLARAVAGMHRAGVVHGALRADTVMFDGDGVPVVACFGSASLIEPGLPPALLDRDPGIHRDRSALAAIVRAVLEAADDREAARSILEWLGAVDRSGRWCEELLGRLEGLAVPAPVRLTADEGSAGRSSIPARLTVHAVPQGLPAPVAGRRSRRRAARPRGSGVMLFRVPVGEAMVKLGAVRKRVWVLAASVTVALIAAVLLLPPNGGPSAEAVSTPTPARMSPNPSRSPAASAGGDPVAAFVALMAVRAQCLQDRSVLCLDQVGQSGSSALDEDQDLVRALQQGEEAPKRFTPSAEALVVTERFGDAALLSVVGPADDQPAAVLVTRSEQGWRVRAYF